MEFPHLGQHCSETSCNRLDFLPVKCDSCNKVFCSNHYNYERHGCSSAHRKDLQVPICPLCSEPVPTAPGVEPDVTVGQHIDQQCKSDTKKIYTNRCNQKGCKRKELIPVTCSQCKLNFCLRHRHTSDHDCKGAAAASSSTTATMSDAERRAMAANAAEYRRTNKPTTLFNTKPKPTAAAARAAATQRNATARVHAQNVQGELTEDEALARALALSIMELDENADRRRNEDAATAAQRAVPVGGQQNLKDKCSLS